MIQFLQLEKPIVFKNINVCQTIKKKIHNTLKVSLTQMYLHNNVVDGYMNKFNKEPNEAHYAKTNSSGNSNFLEFCKIKLKNEKE